MSLPGLTDAISIVVTVLSAAESWQFDCLELRYKAAMHGAYEIQVLLISDVAEFAFQANNSNLQLQRWAKVAVQSQHFNNLTFAGQIQAIAGTSRAANGQELIWLTLVPECHTLFVNQRSGIYLDASVLDLIQRGLVQRFQDLKYTKTKVKQSLVRGEAFYPPQTSMTQYAEPDLHFILRQLSEYGIWACLRQDFSDKGNVTLQLGDHNGALNSIGEVHILNAVNHEAAGLYNVALSNTRLTDTVRAIYFDETEGQYCIKTVALGQAGLGVLDHHCLGNTLTEIQVETIAHLLQESLLQQGQVLEAEFQGLPLQPGDLFELALQGQMQPFIVVSIHYEFAKGDPAKNAATQFSQKHHLKALALNNALNGTLTYRPPVWLKDGAEGFKRPYPHYDYQGILSGCYGLPTDEIVVPNAFGNIPLQFPYNYTEVCGSHQARYTRVISPSNQGGKTGRSFPVYSDTELQVLFAQGNMDFPLIKGAAANAQTGHVHNSSVQNRTHYALPQGQYLTYSNVPGDHNFATFGATHSEGAGRSFMMLSNTQNPNQPGTKQLDSQIISNQSFERVTGGDFHSLQGGNSTVLEQKTQQQPMTYIQFVIGDQTNLQNPSLAPMLTDYLQGIGADLKLTLQNGTVRKVQGLTVMPQEKGYAIRQRLAPTADPGVPITVTTIAISLYHMGRNGTDKTLAVNVIAQNTQPIFPVSTLTFTAQQWQQNKQKDSFGNTLYTVNLNVLAPPWLFNFRQDAWQQQLADEDLSLYQTLKPYFTEETYQTRFRTQPFTQSELDFFATFGNNVTLFIHGFNVNFGAWPLGLNPVTGELGGAAMPLCRDDVYCTHSNTPVATQLQSLPIAQRYGSGAHKWTLCMEHSLNQAAGFDGKDYSQYTRIIGIAWQGNPTSALDYSAANAMTLFPAKQVLALIQQLQARGIKINLMAHSLGSGVLLHILNQCGAQGITINHAFLWDAAIPNTAFDTPTDDTFMPMKLPNPINGQLQDIPYEFTFPDAAKGAQFMSVLYSEQDTVLGAIPSNDSAWSVLHETAHDPGGGLGLAASAETTQALTDALAQSGIRRPLNSVYYVANLFVYPLSFFTTGTRPLLEGYYQLWRQTWPQAQWPTPAGNTYQLASTLETQRSQMAFYYPRLFDLISAACNLDDTDTTSIEASFNDLTDKEKATAAILHALSLSPFMQGVTPLAALSISNAKAEHAKDVAAIILTALLCSNVQPAPALGYNGIDRAGSYYKNANNKSLFQSDQTKPGTQTSDKDHYLCVDHDAMLFPSPDFMKYIYTQLLMHDGSNIKFKYFGQWKPA